MSFDFFGPTTGSMLPTNTPQTGGQTSPYIRHLLTPPAAPAPGTPTGQAPSGGDPRLAMMGRLQDFLSRQGMSDDPRLQGLGALGFLFNPQAKGGSGGQSFMSPNRSGSTGVSPATRNIAQALAARTAPTGTSA